MNRVTQVIDSTKIRRVVLRYIGCLRNKGCTVGSFPKSTISRVDDGEWLKVVSTEFEEVGDGHRVMKC